MSNKSFKTQAFTKIRKTVNHFPPLAHRWTPPVWPPIPPIEPRCDWTWSAQHPSPPCRQAGPAFQAFSSTTSRTQRCISTPCRSNSPASHRLAPDLVESSQFHAPSPSPSAASPTSFNCRSHSQPPSRPPMPVRQCAEHISTHVGSLLASLRRNAYKILPKAPHWVSPLPPLDIPPPSPLLPEL